MLDWRQDLIEWTLTDAGTSGSLTLVQYSEACTITPLIDIAFLREQLSFFYPFVNL